MPSIDEQIANGQLFVSLRPEGVTLVAIPSEDINEDGDFQPRANPPREYIAGPMRGYEQWNFPAFDAARDARLEKGIQVISPADLDRARGITEETTDFSPGDFEVAMRIDTYAVLSCTGIFMLKGWSESTGAKYELMLAQQLGLVVTFAGDAEVGSVVLGAIVDNPELAYLP